MQLNCKHVWNIISHDGVIFIYYQQDFYYIRTTFLNDSQSSLRRSKHYHQFTSPLSLHLGCAIWSQSPPTVNTNKELPKLMTKIPTIINHAIKYNVP